MKAHPLHGNCNGFRHQDSMGAEAPKTAGSNSPFRSTEHPFRPLPSKALDAGSNETGIDAVGSAWDRGINHLDTSSHEEHHSIRHDRGLHASDHVERGDSWRNNFSPPCRSRLGIPDQLVELIRDMVESSEGGELGDAFLYAADLPPITKQSLSELDIQNIITNIKLRHDVNFDRDLSFRPNFDGAKGQEKMRSANRYWQALNAELLLYIRLFQGTPSIEKSEHADWPALIQHAQRRIPKMFETIQEVLKSLVPERDHSRVDDHLDIKMLMQEIARGVFDIVRLAEWMAHLLKEHCAPMRDSMVDNMVERTRSGVVENSTKEIVDGLSHLMGILEAMKLDVANHQIRNLKALLIEDTVNFERNYHLERIVNGRTRIDIEAAQRWFQFALEEFRPRCTPPPRDTLRLQLDVFARAVVSTLFAQGERSLPDTFYLDQERLRSLKSEVEDLVFSDICFTMFEQLLKEFGYGGPVSPFTKRVLQNSLSAIIGEGMGHGPQQWMMNSEHISLELMRQASIIADRPLTVDLNAFHTTNQILRNMFYESFTVHASTLEATMLPQILASISRYINSSPTDLFNSLVGIPNTSNPLPPPPPPPHTPIFPTLAVPQTPSDTLASAPDQLTDIINRITHIILLHWRIWGPITYVQDEETPISTSEEKLSASPTPQTCPPPPVDVDADAPVVTAMKTGEQPPDPGQETQLAHETSLP